MGFFEAIFFFFTASTRLYEILIDSLKSAGSYVCVPKLAKIADDPDEMPKVRCGQMAYMSSCSIYSVFWHEILDRVIGTNKQPQDPKLELNAAVATVKSLIGFVETKRECFYGYEWQGASGTTQYVQTRQRRRIVRLNTLNKAY